MINLSRLYTYVSSNQTFLSLSLSRSLSLSVSLSVSLSLCLSLFLSVSLSVPYQSLIVFLYFYLQMRLSNFELKHFCGSPCLQKQFIGRVNICKSAERTFVTCLSNSFGWCSFVQIGSNENNDALFNRI